VATAVALKLGPARVDLSGIRAGDRNRLTITLSSNGAPFDLSAVTATAQARATADAIDAIDATVTILDPAAGELALEWPGDLVAGVIVPPATTWRGVWDLQLAGVDGTVTVAAGTFAAELDITRP
jgi:hypothetical protein